MLVLPLLSQEKWPVVKKRKKENTTRSSTRSNKIRKQGPTLLTATGWDCLSSLSLAKKLCLTLSLKGEWLTHCLLYFLHTALAATCTLEGVAHEGVLDLFDFWGVLVDVSIQLRAKKPGNDLTFYRSAYFLWCKGAALAKFSTYIQFEFCYSCYKTNSCKPSSPQTPLL